MNRLSKREVLLLNSGWKFARYGDMPDGSVSVEPEELFREETDDAAWRELDLPHDWGIEGPFRMDLPGQTGKLPWAGVGWYRRKFDIPDKDRGKQIFIDFDGAMSHAGVWLNGRFVGGRPYGYSSFRLDLTEYIYFGGENTLAVRLENPPDSSRWYPGAGIYRSVRLVKVNPVHVAHWGVFITTPEVTDRYATVNISCRIENRQGSSGMISVKHAVFLRHEPGRKMADIAVGGELTASCAEKTVTGAVRLDGARRWDTVSPVLYMVQTTLYRDGEIVDQVQTDFGIRTIEFNADRGFLLNGRVLKLQGVCLHHDLGPLGAAAYPRAIERQLEIMKDMGCNAIRTAHNPPAPELLDLCDRMGFLVQVESFDCWAEGKSPNDYSTLYDQWHGHDLASMVRRDRNHPSVIMWSTGNEVVEQWAGEDVNLDVSRHLADIVHREDSTRPVSVGWSNPEAGFNGFQETVDVFGYNYKPELYRKFREENPGIPLYGSETASCISSRGEYFFPVVDDISKGAGGYFQVSSYDLFAPPWASPPDTEFEAQDRNPEVFGEFVWTGFDYIGEPTPYNRDTTNLLNFSDPGDRAAMEGRLAQMGKNIPPRSSYFGIADLCGFPKDRYYLYQSRWRPDLPMVHILPHWNWPDRIGQVTPVHIYTSGDEAELFLNGQSLGRKKKGQYEYRLRWDDLVYQPGVLKAVAFRHGEFWAECVVETAGPAAQLQLSADRPVVFADGKDLGFITVRVVDENGRMVPRADHAVSFELSGPAELIAVGNGNPVCHSPFRSHQQNVFNGLCLAVVKSRKGLPGEIDLRAFSKGLRPASVKLESVCRGPLKKKTEFHEKRGVDKPEPVM